VRWRDVKVVSKEQGVAMAQIRHIKSTKKYEHYLKALGSLSGLFSDSDRPLINYRTAEKLFNLVSGASDVGRQDGSFDSKLVLKNDSAIGVGVKTFTTKTAEHSSIEKIAEFSKPAFVKVLAKLKGKSLARAVSEFRNNRVTSDALQLGIDLENSYYHCVVRIPGAVVLHEEAYELIDIEKLYPTDRRGKKVPKWGNSFDGHLYFGDGKHLYTFHRGKNVLNKRFELNKGFTSGPIKIGILANAIDRIADVFGGFGASGLSGEAGGIKLPAKEKGDLQVVLPLYTPGKMIVQAKSGLNGWNAGGRDRKFGEAYIPIPAIVHKIEPGFFPPKDKKFVLSLPNGDRISAKVCQQGSKALMSDPNTAMFFWLYELIDGDLGKAQKRASSKKPYTYDDLVKIGKDAVAISKSGVNGVDYKLELVSIGSFEAFLDGVYLEDES
jgi:hypothetical protein